MKVGKLHPSDVLLLVFLMCCCIPRNDGKIVPNKSLALSTKHKATPLDLQKRYAFLDGFGRSGIKSLDDDEIFSSSSSSTSTLRSKKRKHVFSSVVSLALFGILLSRRFLGESYWIAVGIALIVYFVEAARSSTRKFLSNMLSPQAVEDLMKDIRDTNPVLRMELECYHYRSTYTRTDKGTVREESSKHVTHRASQDFLYRECRDRTDTADLLNTIEYESSTQNPFLQISIAKLLVFQNDDVYEDYLNQFSRFIMQQGNRDRHTDTSTRLLVPGLQSEKILAVRTVLGVHDHARLASFWLSTLVGLTVPYRRWFDSHCDELDLVVTKEVH